MSLPLRLIGLGGSHAITLLGGVLWAILWTRFLPKELYGEYKIIQSVLTFIAAFCFVGVGHATLMSATRSFDGNFTALLKTKVWANGIGAAVILLIAIYYATIQEQIDLAIGLLVASFLFVGFNLVEVWTSWLNGKSFFRELNLGRIGLSLLPLIFLLLLILADISDLWMIVAITFSATCIINLFMLYFAAKKRTSNSYDQGSISYARRTTIALSFGALLSLDVIVLEHFHGAAEVAIFAVALLLPNQLRVGFGLLNQALAPRVYGTTSLQKVLRELRPVFYRVVFISVIIAWVGYAFFPYVVEILFSESYLISGEIGRRLWLFSALTAPFNTLLGAVVVSRQNVSLTYVGNIGYPLIYLGFCFFFLQEGAGGFIDARIAVYCVTTLFYLGSTWWLLRKEIAFSSKL